MDTPRPKRSPRIRLADLAAHNPTLTEAQAARLGAMSQVEIDAAADADPIAPTWTKAMLDRAVFARAVKRARAASGLSQPAFASRFRIGVARLRNWEQGRTTPDPVGAAYVQTILFDAKMVEKALAVHRG